MNIKGPLILALSATLAGGCSSDYDLFKKKEDTGNVVPKDREPKPEEETTTTITDSSTGEPIEMTFKEIRQLCTELMDSDLFIPVDTQTVTYAADAVAERNTAQTEGMAQFVAGVNDHFERTDLTLDDIDNLVVPMGIWVEHQTEYVTSMRISPDDNSDFYQDWHWAIDPWENFPVLTCSIHGIDGVFFSATSTAAYSGDQAHHPTLHSLHSDAGNAHYINTLPNYDCGSGDFICITAIDSLQSYGEDFRDLTEKILGSEPFAYFPQ